MEEPQHRLWHTVREFATHWSVAGAILAATGAAPEHWVADVMHHVPMPHGTFPPWLEQVDYRLVAVIVGLSIIVGDNLWRHHRKSRDVATPTAVSAPEPYTRASILPLPDRPSIAVLPFTNLSGDPEQEYFSDGVADDIITELSHDRALFVIARNSSFTYRDRVTEIRQIGLELGVRYIVEGTVRRDAQQVRVSAQLIDAANSSHVWAGRYDRALEKIFSVQDDIAASVATAVRPAVHDAEQRRIVRKPPSSLTAWESYQRGSWHLSRITPEGNVQAREFFQQAIEIDPGLSAAFVGLGFVAMSDTLLHGVRTADEMTALMEAAARQAIEADPNDSEALAMLSLAFIGKGNHAATVEWADRALVLNGNSAAAHMAKGASIIYAGCPASGRTELNIGLRLNPRDPLGSYAYSSVAASHYFEHAYEAAVDAARRGLDVFPENQLARRWLAAALGQLGRTEEAAAVLLECMTFAPGVFDIVVRHRVPYVKPRDHEHMLDGLRKAGWKG
jgi:adenylate cyclase